MNIRQGLYYVKIRLIDILCILNARSRNFKPEENIMISSYPRSGSTWLMELVNEIPGTVNLWEPLHLKNVEVFDDLDFGWRQYIPEDKEWEKAEEAFQKLFRGDYLNFWLSSRSSPMEFTSADQMIVKFVRANAMLPWLTKRFNFQYEPIYLLRHPFAVAASQLKEGSWDPEFNGYKLPDMPYNEVYKTHFPFLLSLKSRPEEMVADWCINNKIVLENDRHQKDWIPIYYEEILLYPEKVLHQIFNRWDIPMPESILKKVRKPSSTTKGELFKDDIDKQLSKWQQFFDKDTITRLQRVLNYFEVDIYSDKILPEKLN